MISVSVAGYEETKSILEKEYTLLNFSDWKEFAIQERMEREAILTTLGEEQKRIEELDGKRFELGKVYIDTVTGWVGRAVSICYNLKGSSQVLLQAIDGTGKLMEHWFERDRLGEV